jgi:phospholipid/cholesterol/gamma-HCH transport system substrate-binding protein
VIAKSQLRREGLTLAAFVVGCLVALAFMWTFAGGQLNPTATHYSVQAVVPSAVSLGLHADVRQAGVRIGSVEGIARHGTNVVLQLQLDPDHSPVYNDARVLVRSKTLTGENYVDLDPGKPSAGRVVSGGVLSIAHAGQSVQFDQLLSTFDGSHRRDLQRLLQGLGRGLGGRGDALNRFLEGSDATVTESRPVAQVLAADRAQVASLVDDLGWDLRALGDRANSIRTLTRQGTLLAEAVAARDGKVRSTLALLPGFLKQARATSTHLGGFSLTATPVVHDLRLATEDMAPTVALLQPTATRARATMNSLSRFTRAANPMAAYLRPFARATAGVAPNLEAVLRQVNPALDYLAPYAREFGSLASNLRDGSEQYDALGHYSHTHAYVGKSGVTALFTPEQDAAYQALIKSGALTPIDTRGLNPYPKPGALTHLEPWSGTFPRIQENPRYR